MQYSASAEPSPTYHSYQILCCATSQEAIHCAPCCMPCVFNTAQHLQLQALLCKQSRAQKRCSVLMATTRGESGCGMSTSLLLCQGCTGAKIQHCCACHWHEPCCLAVHVSKLRYLLATMVPFLYTPWACSIIQPSASLVKPQLPRNKVSVSQKIAVVFVYRWALGPTSGRTVVIPLLIHCQEHSQFTGTKPASFPNLF